MVSTMLFIVQTELTKLWILHYFNESPSSVTILFADYGCYLIMMMLVSTILCILSININVLSPQNI